MSLQSICSAVLSEVGWPTLTAYSTSSDPTAKQIVALANKELVTLSEQYDWPQLDIEYTFDTVAAQATYDLPTNFRKMIGGSVYNADEYYRLRGSVNVETWNRHKYGLLGSIAHQRYRLRYDAADGGEYIELAETPTTAETLVMVYQTNEYARTSENDDNPKYEADTDVAKIPESIVQAGVAWRFRRAKGLDFSAELAEYGAIVKTQLAKYLQLSTLPVGKTDLLPEITEGYVPDNGYGV